MDLDAAKKSYFCIKFNVIFCKGINTCMKTCKIFLSVWLLENKRNWELLGMKSDGMIYTRSDIFEIN